MNKKITFACLTVLVFFQFFISECSSKEISAFTGNQDGLKNSTPSSNQMNEISSLPAQWPDINCTDSEKINLVGGSGFNGYFEMAQSVREKGTQSGKNLAAQSPATKEYIGMCFLEISSAPQGGIAMTPFFQDHTSCKKYRMEERVPAPIFLTNSPVPCRVAGYIKGNAIVYDAIKRITGGEIEDLYDRFSSKCGGPSYDSLLFKRDPKASVKFNQIHDTMVLDTETILKNKMAEMLKKKDCHFIAILDVIVKDNARFLNATVPSDNSIKIMLIIRTGEDNAIVATWKGHYAVKLNDLDRTDVDINKAIETIKRSALLNPSVLVIDNKFFDEENADIFMLPIVREAGKGLEKHGFDINKGYLLFPNSVPNYLIGDGNKYTYFDLFNSFRKKDYGRLSDLLVLEGENKSRDYYTSNNKPKYLFVSTKNSAPIEMNQSDLSQIASIQESSNHDIYSVVVTAKNGIKITFRGLSAVNKDFMKSENPRWNAVLGLSSPNGFIIAIQYKQGKNTINVSGDEVRKNTQNIQERLPTSVVEMIQYALRD